MTVDANTGNKDVDKYGDQINRLEKQAKLSGLSGKALDDYDKALEKQFAAVKAQLLGNGGAAHGSGDGGPAATHSGGTGGGGSAGGHDATVADSVAKIKAAAGPDAANAVKKIADRAGATVGQLAVKAGANAAQQVIASHGTPQRAADAAQAAAQAVATAGRAGGPEAATYVGEVVRIADPATAQQVANIAQNAVRSGGAAAGEAVAEAGERAAAFARAAGASAEVIADAAIGGAQAALEAAQVSFQASGGVAAGADAARSAARAARAGGVDAARWVARAARYGGAASADAVGEVAVLGGRAGANINGVCEDVVRAAEAGGAAAAEAVRDVANRYGRIGGDYVFDIVVRFASNAAEAGGPEAAQAVGDVADRVIRAGGSADNVIRAADGVDKAIQSVREAGGDGTQVALAAANVVRAVDAVRVAGGNGIQMEHVALSVGEGAELAALHGSDAVGIVGYTNGIAVAASNTANGSQSASLVVHSAQNAAAQLGDPTPPYVPARPVYRGDGASIVKDPLDGLRDPLTEAYLALQVDVAGGVDQQKIKADADHLAQLANDSGQTGLASAATHISNSIIDGSYDQDGSLTALMDNSPTLSSTVQVPPLPPSQAGAYQKLVTDIKSGADNTTIMNDVLSFAAASIRNGDFGLAQVAIDIGKSVKGNTYDKDTALTWLTGAVSG